MLRFIHGNGRCLRTASHHLGHPDRLEVSIGFHLPILLCPVHYTTLVGMRMLIALAVLVSTVAAQSFTVPTSWREPNNDRSSDELVRIAQAADDSFKSLYNSTTGLLNNIPYYDLDAITYSALARKDRYAGTQNNRWVVDAIKAANRANQGFIYEDLSHHPMIWGIAALDGYKTYKDSGLLQIAYNAWNYSSQYQISEAQASAGRHPAKSYSFVSSCNGVSIAGAVLWNTNFTGSMYMYTITPGHFAVFSGLLADLEASEGRDNTKYKNAAVLTGNYLLNLIVDPDSSLALNLLFINGTDACTYNRATWSRNTGNVIEAFAVLADLTGDSKWTNAMNRVVIGATTNTAWTGNDGVVTESSQSTDVYERALKGRYVASFYEPWTRTKNDGFKSYISSYLNVQNNALLDLATANNLGFYSSNWHGPAATTFIPDGMVAAVDLTAIVIASSNTSASSVSSTSASKTSTATSSSSTSTSTQTHKSNNLAVPLGVGLGVGIPVLLLALCGAFFLCRRRRNREIPSTPQFDHEKFNQPTQGPSGLNSTPFVPPNNQPESQLYTPTPVPMPMTAPATAPSPQPGNIQFATTPGGKETMLTWQGQPQADAASGSGVNQNPGENLPTADLVRILNDRVNRGYDPQGDGPPVYQETPR